MLRPGDGQRSQFDELAEVVVISNAVPFQQDPMARASGHFQFSPRTKFVSFNPLIDESLISGVTEERRFELEDFPVNLNTVYCIRVHQLDARAGLASIIQIYLINAALIGVHP